MPTFTLYQIDAFADQVFRGNPAAVVPLEDWLPDATLQAIAAENNLSETAFFVRNVSGYHLRWFTPLQEVPLCGHATLATAHVILRRLTPGSSRVEFTTLSGPLAVTRAANGLTLDFPRLEPVPVPSPPASLARGLGLQPVEVFETRGDPNYFAVYTCEAEVRGLRPDLAMLGSLHPFGVAATARGIATDIVSRYFAPSYGIPEDPVTGSIHCALTPWWAARLGRTELTAYQASARGGSLRCRVVGDRVYLTGSAVEYFQGTIEIPG
jgi:PhzF family phenazine biosynthesis protein